MNKIKIKRNKQREFRQSINEALFVDEQETENLIKAIMILSSLSHTQTLSLSHCPHCVTELSCFTLPFLFPLFF